MDAAALAAPRSLAAPGVLHLHLELRWRDTVLVARSFTHGVWSGPTKYHPFPLEGFECDPNGFVLATRDGDSYLLTPPLGASPARPLRLNEGQSCEYTRGELGLRAWVTREQQVLTLDWLWPVCAPFAFLLAWRMVEWFGVIFAFVLMLIPRAPPPVVTAPPDTSTRLVKVLPMLHEVKPEPLPQTPRDRLKLLMSGKRSDEIFKDAAKRSAEREKRKAVLQQMVSAKGTLTLLAALEGPRENEAQLVGLIGSLKGSDSLGVGGFGTSASGLRAIGGGTGLGVASIGELRAHEPNPAEEKARALAKTSGQKCWNEADDDGSVLMRVSIAPDGGVTPHPISTDAPGRVVACLENELREWKLPATDHGGRITVRFRNER